MRRSAARAWYAFVAVLNFVVADHANVLTRLLTSRRLVPLEMELGLRNIFQVILCFGGISLAHRSGVRRAARELGLGAPVRRALAFAFLASLPMLIAFASTSRINPRMSWRSVGVGCLLAPFAEEILFRAYLFRQLYRHARLGFWLAALLPSVLFALGHVYQSGQPAELAGILAITGLGSILACWIFMRWQDNLWAVFGLHALMNLWWEVFAIDDTALGGWVANFARLGTVALAIVLTIFKDRLWRPLPIEAENAAAGNSADKEVDRVLTGGLDLAQVIPG